MAEPKLPAHLVEQARDDLARFDGTAPYDVPSNPCVNDGYYAASLRKKYGMDVDALRRAVRAR